MRPGPSFSEIGIAALAAVALAAAAPAPPRALPGPGGSDAPSATAPASIPCPRCGYRNDPDARHCVACGWDLAILVGDAAQRRLQAIGEAVVGVVVAKEYVSASSMLAPKYSKWLRLLAPDEGEHGKHRHFGTAFPLGRAGLFVTSARLLDRAVEARVRTFDNRQFPAEILAYDLPTGIGLIKADVPGVKPLALGERGPEPPEGAWVICFPVALEGKVVRYLPQSLHRGQVTALAQTGTGLASFEYLVRSDHSIPEGCPGAPLIDRRGGLVGMVLDSPEPALTYSVPAPAFVSLVDALARGEVPERPYFGMGLVGPDARRRDKFALAASASQALVAYVIPGSPAEASGVRAGDLLLAVGGEKVGTPSAAAARL
ncbi:MAG: hypothetical protein DMF50_13945, partial [Acidobacteria bacterium]